MSKFWQQLWMMGDCCHSCCVPYGLVDLRRIKKQAETGLQVAFSRERSKTGTEDKRKDTAPLENRICGTHAG